MHEARSLLFALTALELGFLGRDALREALTAWASDRTRPLPEFLAERGLLDGQQCQLTDAMTGEMLNEHGQDLSRCLAAFGSLSLLRGLGDGSLDTLIDNLTAPSLHPDASPATRVPHLVEPLPVAARFQIVRPLAAGGLGQVFVARDEQLRREVALKEIQPRHADDAVSRARFLREAEITGGLEHPGIVPIYALGAYPDGRPYYAMRLVQGETLQDALLRYHTRERRNPRTLRQLLRRLVDVCNAIAYAHAQGVIHRDLKPENILLGAFGETVLIDWGLAKRRHVESEKNAPPESHASEPAPEATVAGQAVGTPQFMSPEQAAGALDALGPATDIYSLGATLYCLLTGVPPVEGTNLGDMLRRVIHGEFPTPRQRLRSIPAGLDAICRKAMALRPQDRYASAKELADDLERWLADEAVSVHRESLAGRLARWSRRHRAWALAGSLALVLVATVGVSAAVLIDSQRDEAVRQKNEAEILAGRLATEQQATEQARTQEEQQRHRAELRLADYHFAHGQALCQQGKSGEGLLWFVRAFETAARVPLPAARDLEDVLRRNLDAWGKNINAAGQLLHQGNTIGLLRFSPDGTKLLTGTVDGTGQLWDVATAKKIGEPLVPTGTRANLASASFDPTGKLLLSGLESTGDAQFWNADTGKPIGRPFKNAGSVNFTAFHSDGERALTAGDNTALLWNAKTGLAVGIPMKHKGNISAAFFLHDGKRILTASWDGTVQLWDAANGKHLREVLTGNLQVQMAAVSPDDQTLVVLRQQIVEILDLNTGKPKGKSLNLAGTRLHLARMSPDGKRLLSVGSDKTRVGIYRLPEGQWLADLPLNDRLTDAEFNADGSVIATGSADGTVRFWDASTAAPLGSSLSHRHLVKTIAFSPDGKRVAVGTGAGGIFDNPGEARIWPLNLEPSVAPIQLSDDWTAMHFTPDSRLAVAVRGFGSEMRGLRVLEIPSGKPLGPDIAFDFPLNNETSFQAFQLSANGQTMATLHLDGSVQLWDVTTGKASRAAWKLPQRPATFSFSPKADLLATVDAPTGLRLWDIAQGQPKGEAHKIPGNFVPRISFNPAGTKLLVLPHGGPPALLAIKSGEMQSLTHTQPPATALWFTNSERVLTVTLDGQLNVWNANNAALIKQSRLPAAGLMPFAVSPDDRHVLVGLRRSVRLVDVESGRFVGPPLGDFNENYRAGFSVDGRMVYAGPYNRELYLWDRATGKALGSRLAPEGPHPLAFDPAGRWIAGQSRSQRTIHFFPLPQAMPGDAETLRLSAELRAGLALGADDEVQTLSTDALKERRERLQKRKAE